MLIGSGRIKTGHASPECIAASLSPDNLKDMEMAFDDGCVWMTIEEKPVRSILASVDDYLMNLSIADVFCNGNRDETQDEGISSQ